MGFRVQMLSRRRTHLSKQAAFRLERFGLTPDQIEAVSLPPQASRFGSRSTQFFGNRRVAKSRRRPVRQRRGHAYRIHGSQNGLGESRCVRYAISREFVRGSAATITSEAMPALKLTGKVDFIEPHSDPQTRTTPVRIQVENPGTRLKPGMIVQTAFQISRWETCLLFRAKPCIDTGIEKIVYVARDNGVFEQQTYSSRLHR